jgi:hypothetical protein
MFDCLSEQRERPMAATQLHDTQQEGDADADERDDGQRALEG